MKEKKIKNIFVAGAVTPEFIAGSIAKHSTKKDIGAHSIFLGQVRNDLIDGNEVLAIQYSAYEEMANEVFDSIRESMFLKYELKCLHVYHSLGEVKAGEISLFVFTSAKHRKAAISACEEIVELLKQQVSIWGQEVFADGSSAWKENNV
jgi:molybdopterin synthase catalytic subunit